MKEQLEKVIAGESLTQAEASTVFDRVMRGEVTPSQLAGLIVALKAKGESIDEIAGFVEAMRSHMIPFPTNHQVAVDGCGTGGDGKHTFNVSTAASIIAAGAGAKVAKHGNRSVSSRCGSADLLEAAGAQLDMEAPEASDLLDRFGFTFLFAQRYHPAMRHAAVPRRELGIRSVFNILGPMTNPARVKRQVIGVYDPRLMGSVAQVLQRTGSDHVLVVHSRDGHDEISVSAPTDFVELRDDAIRLGTIFPESLGIDPYPETALEGGNSIRNLEILHEVLRNVPSACLEASLVNAAALLYVAGQAESIEDGLASTRTAVSTGRARDNFAHWIEASRNH